MKPKVSVVWPTYNDGKYLYFALESLVSQTFKDFEVLIWDDGSTDDTKHVISQFESQLSIKAYYEKNHAGDIDKFTAAWNTLASDAQGELLCTFASTSLFHPTRLEKQVAVMASDEFAATYSMAAHIDSEGKQLENCFVAPKGVTPETSVAKMFLGNFIPTPSVMIRKSIFLGLGGFRAEYKFIQDYDMWFRAMKKGKFLYIAECLIAYRIHDRSRSQNSGVVSVMGELIPKLIAEMYEYYDIQEIIPELAKYDIRRDRDVFAQAHWSFGNSCLQRANRLKMKEADKHVEARVYYELAFKEFEKSLEFKPSALAYAASALSAAGLGSFTVAHEHANMAVRMDSQFVPIQNEIHEIEKRSRL